MSSRPILLDTCAALWLVDGLLDEKASRKIQEAVSADVQILVSPITAWEVGMLISKKRLTMSLPVLAWFNRLTELGVVRAELSPEVLVASTELRTDELRDPADLIIAATARAFNYRLMTRDRPLLGFAASGQVSAISC